MYVNFIVHFFFFILKVSTFKALSPILNDCVDRLFGSTSDAESELIVEKLLRRFSNYAFDIGFIIVHSSDFPRKSALGGKVIIV